MAHIRPTMAVISRKFLCMLRMERMKLVSTKRCAEEEIFGNHDFSSTVQNVCIINGKTKTFVTNRVTSAHSMDRTLKCDHFWHRKAVKQYLTVALFVFQFYTVCNFGKFISFGLGTVRSERVMLSINFSWIPNVPSKNSNLHCKNHVACAPSFNFQCTYYVHVVASKLLTVNNWHSKINIQRSRKLLRVSMP